MFLFYCVPSPHPFPNCVRGKTCFPSIVLQSVYWGLWIKPTKDGLTGDRQVSLLMLMFLCAWGRHRRKWKPKDAITHGGLGYDLYTTLMEGDELVAQLVKKQTNKTPCNAGDPRDVGSITASGRFPWRRKWQPTPAFLPGESHGRRSLVGLESTRLQRVGHDWVHMQACRTGQRKRYLGSQGWWTVCRELGAVLLSSQC